MIKVSEQAKVEVKKLMEADGFDSSFQITLGLELRAEDALVSHMI